MKVMAQNDSPKSYSGKERAKGDRDALSGSPTPTRGKSSTNLSQAKRAGSAELKKGAGDGATAGPNSEPPIDATRYLDTALQYDRKAVFWFLRQFFISKNMLSESEKE